MAILLKVPSWNTLQIEVQLLATTCSSYYYLICFLHNHMIPPTTPPPKKPNDIFIHCQMNTQTDTNLLHGVHFDRGGCNWVCTIDPHDSWTVTCPLPYPSYPASWILLSPFSVQDSRNMSSNDRHHHTLSLENNKTGIIPLSKCVTDVN